MTIEEFKDTNLENFIFYSIEDEKAVFNFLGKEYERYNALEYFISYQRDIINQRALVRNQKISIELDKSIQILNVPKNFEEWTKASNFNKDFIFLKEDLNNLVSGFCLDCKQKFSFSKEFSTYYNKIICPNCKKKKKMKWEEITDKIIKMCNAFYIQRNGENEIIVRVFYYELILDNNKYKYNLEEFFRSYIVFNKENINKKSYIKENNIWKRVSKNSENIYSNSNYSNFIYTENLREVLFGTPYQFSCLLESALNIKNLNPIIYLNEYQKYPYIEYLIKLKFYKLVEDILKYGPRWNVNKNGKTIVEFLKLKKQWIKVAQKLNVNNVELEILQLASSMPIKTNVRTSNSNFEKEKNVYISEETLKWFLLSYQEDYSKTESFKIFIEILKYIPQKKAIQYIEQQNNIIINGEQISLREILFEWREYLKFCFVCKLNLKNTLISMPKDLFKNYHNSIVSYSSDDENKDYNNQIAQLYEELHNIYSFQNEKFIIKIPKSADEIINEAGPMLRNIEKIKRNCIENMASSKNAILFIRKIESPEKPYCIVEVSKAEVLQIIKYNDERVLDLDFESFINEWKNHLNKVK